MGLSPLEAVFLSNFPFKMAFYLNMAGEFCTGFQGLKAALHLVRRKDVQRAIDL